ncbi:Ig-like domain-containing protein [Methanobrevibacter sp.]
MKKYYAIFSIFFVFILVGVSCASAAEIDDSDPLMLENTNLELSQVDNVDLNSENEILNNYENDQVSQGDNNFNEDLLEETISDSDSVNDDELILDDSAYDIGSKDSLLSSQIDESIVDSRVAEEGSELSSLGATSAVDGIGVENLEENIPDLVCFAIDFEDFSLFLSYMQLRGTPEGESIRQYLSAIYQETIPKEHSNTMRLRYDIRTIDKKLIPTINKDINMTIDGQGHTVDMAGGDNRDHYIVVKAGNVTFKNIIFTNGYNNDGDNGGALSIEGSGTCTILNCTFKNCYAKDSGGAIDHRNWNELVINDSTFIGNMAEDYDGGAIYSNGDLYLNHCTFESNVARDGGDGGAVYSKNAVTLNGSRFINNRADDDGGAICAAYQLWSFGDPSYFEGNVAGSDGGAIYVDELHRIISGSRFIRNTASGGCGGAIYSISNHHDFIGCAYVDNKADDDGGAIYSKGVVDTYENVFIGNTADLGKIVYSLNHHSETLRNWYGTNNLNWDNAFVYQYPSWSGEDYKYGRDFQNITTSYALSPNGQTNNIQIIFETYYHQHIGPLCISPDDVSFIYDASKFSKFEYSVNSNNVVGATVLAKEACQTNIVAKIFGREVLNVNITLLDPQLSAKCHDIIKGEETSVFVEAYLNESINGNLVSFGNESVQGILSNGYGYAYCDVRDLDVGNHSLIVQFDGIGFFIPDSVEVPFEIKAKTSPDGVCEFTTLQNRIDNPDINELVLDCDYVYSSVNDGEFKDGVGISRDNFVVDGQGHTIDAKHLARIFDIEAENVTLKNINFINGFGKDGGAVLSNASITIENCTFINNSAGYNGGAVQVNGNCTIEGSNFFNNSAVHAGGVHCTDDAKVDHCNFVGNNASASSAMEAMNMDVKNSIFLNNKAVTSELDLTYENHRIVAYLFANNYYLNAIVVWRNVSFENVTYWKGGIVNSDDSVPTLATSGINITIEIIDYIGNVTVRNVTLLTDDDGRVEFNPIDLEHYNYKVNAYHMDDSYYDYIVSTMDLFLTRNSSSVAIDLEDNVEYTYPNIPDRINFNIINRSEEVRVLITDENGTVYIDNLTDEDYISIAELPLGRDYYRITVFNMGNMETLPSQDSKMFKILKANSSIEVPEIDDCEYPHEYEIYIKGDILTTYNVVIYDSDGNVVFVEENISWHWIDIPVLPVGRYNITVINNGDEKHFESEDSTIFTINVGHVLATFHTHDIDYGNPSFFEVMVAEPGGNYTLDVNGTIAHFEFNGSGVANVTMNLPAGTYEAFFSNDNTNYEIIGVTHLTFTVSPVQNNVVVRALNTSYGQQSFIIITADIGGNYTLDVNGTVVDVEVKDKVGYVALDLDAGNYTTDVRFDNPNYATSVANAEFTVKKGINNVFVLEYTSVDSPDTVGIKITADVDGSYILDVNGSTKFVYVENGEGYAEFVLSPGTYYAKASFDNPNYETFITNTTFEVLPFARELNVKVENCENNSVVISIESNVDGVYMINVSGDYYPIFVVDGKGNRSLSLDEGKYSLGVVLNNVGLLNSVNGENEFEVTSHSRIETQIIYQNMTTTAVDVDTDGRIGKYFYITLKDKNGNLLKNKPVQIGFNGKVYDRITDNNGQAKLQINLKNAGTYTFAIAFLGDDDYNGSFVVAKIVVKKQKGSLTVPNKSYKASAKTKKLTATFKAASGKVVANKKITFTVNGKKYSAITNAKGVATVKVSLNKKGTYKFTAKFAGNSMYAAITKKGKLTIK